MFPDLVKAADSVAHEKNITQEDIFSAIEEALKKAGTSQIWGRTRSPRSDRP